MENTEWTNDFDDLVKKIKQKREETKRKIDNPFGNIVFPMIMKVYTQTIGMDLVSVKPLSTPSLNLIYDDIYESDEDRLKREKYEKRQRVIDSLLGKTKEEFKHEDFLQVTMKYNNNSQVYNHLSKWASLIESVTKNDKKKN
jgi:hypothetical protein